MRISWWAALGLAACGGFQSEALDGGGDGNTTSHFTTVQGQPVGETLMAVWGANADNVFAVGTNGLHDDYYAGAWHRSQVSMGRDLRGVWGSSATDVYAVGEVTGTGQGVVVHFDGQSWRDEYLAATALYGVWGTGNAILAVGAKGSIYGKLRGSTVWGSRLMQGLPANPNVTVTDAADEPILHAIGGTSLTDFAMPADADRIFQYQGGGNYLNLDPTVDRSVVFWSMWADPTTPGSVFFGTNYLGVAWLTRLPAPPNSTLLDNNMYRLTQDQSQPGADQLFIRGVWGSGTRVVFAGDAGRMYSYDAASNDIVTLSSPTDSALWGVWGSSVDDLWVVGERELILHGSL